MAAITLGLQETLYLGNPDARRDWEHARDYVDGMWRIVQQPQPDDYVLATGESHLVRDVVERAFAEVGAELRWRGEGVEEVGFINGSNQTVVAVDPRYFRPTEVDMLLGDAGKARAQLGWRPRAGFEALVSAMVQSDLTVHVLVRQPSSTRLTESCVA